MFHCKELLVLARLMKKADGIIGGSRTTDKMRSGGEMEAYAGGLRKQPVPSSPKACCILLRESTSGRRKIQWLARQPRRLRKMDTWF